MMRQARSWMLAMAMTATLGFAVTSAHAIPCGGPTSLQTAANTGCTFSIGDKLFSNFHISQVSGIGTYILNPSQITVNALQLGPDLGLQFSGLIAALGAGSFADITFSYQVTVTDPAFRLHDIGLFFNGTATGPGALAQVVETVLDTTPSVIGQAVVQTPSPLGQDILLSSDVTTAVVFKDIAVIAGSRPQGVATISFFTQVYSQSTDVPEPGTLVLLGSGLLGLAGVVRQRRKA